MEGTKIKLVLDLLRKKFIFSFITFSVLFLFFFGILLLSEPTYPVSSSIIVEEKDNSVSAASITMLMSGQSQKILNEIEILKSREIVDGIIDEFNLTYRIERQNNTFINYVTRVLTGKPVIEGSLYAESVPEKLRPLESTITVNGDNYTINNKIDTTTCSFDKDCFFMDGILTIKKIGDISDNIKFAAKSANLVKRRESLMSDMTFRTMGDTKESNTVQIIMSIGEPHLAVKIIEAFSNSYITRKLAWNYEDAENQQKFMQKILKDVKNELDEKSNILALYQKENQTILPDLQFAEIMKRSVEIEKEIAILVLQEEIARKYEDTIDPESLNAIPSPVVIDDVSVLMLVQKHNELVARETELLSMFTSSHPELLKVRSDIKTMKLNLKNLVEKTRDNYFKSIGILKKQSEQILSTIDKLPQNLMNIASLQRDVIISEKLYAFLSQKIYEAGITQAMEITPIRILDSPTHLVNKSFPSFSISFIIVSILSFLLTIFILVINVVTKKDIFSPYELKLIDKTGGNVVVFNRNRANSSVDFLNSYMATNPSIKTITVVDTTGVSSLKEQIKTGKEHNILFVSISELTAGVESKGDSSTNIEVNSDLASSFLSSEEFIKKMGKMSENGNKLILILAVNDVEKLPFKLFDISESVFFLTKTGITKRSSIPFFYKNLSQIKSYIKILVED
jgi:uncharacterized protein involved in exopolysaccharide biosynthesis